MNKKNFDLLKHEEEIPEKVMKQVDKNRQNILNGKIQQTNPNKRTLKILSFTLSVAVVLFIILFNK